MNTKLLSCRRSAALSFILAASVSMAPGAARAGFFEDLFGGGIPSAPAAVAPQPSGDPSPSYEYGLPMHRDHRRPKKKMVAAMPAKPVLQKTTALMDDKTLRPGDAIMMKSGVHVYAGPEESHHDADQFVALDHARHLSAKERDQLIAMDVTRRDPLEYVANDRTVLHEGRSIGDQPIVKGYRITDARGRSIRYVGP